MLSSHEKTDYALDMLPIEARMFAGPSCYVKTYRNGEYIAHAGTQLQGPMFVLSGIVSVGRFDKKQSNGHIHGDKQETILCFARQYRWQMGIQVMKNETLAYDARAVGDVELLIWPRASFVQAFKHCETLREFMGDHCVDSMHFVMSELESSLTHTLPQRLARRLLDLADKAGVPLADSPSVKIEAPVSNALLAASLGVTRQRIHSQLREWSGLGWVSSNRRDVVLHAPDALRSAAYA